MPNHDEGQIPPESRPVLPQVSAREPATGGLRSAATHALVALLCFLATSQVIGHALPGSPPALDLPVLEAKLGEMQRAGGHFDFLFVGSSRVFRGIDPAAIQDRAQALGCDIRSYNLGISGLSLLEQKAVLDRVRNAGIRASTIFVDPYSVAERTLDGYLSDRRRHFYTWENLRQLVFDQWTLPVSSWVRTRNLGYLGFAFAREQVGVGRLSQALFPHTQEQQMAWDKPIRAGFMPIEEESDASYARRRREFLERLEVFEHRVAEGKRAPYAPRSSGARYSLVLELVGGVRSAGATPAVLVMPSLKHIQHAGDLVRRIEEEAETPLEILNLNDPSRYGELFSHENFFDQGHLHRKGSHAVADILAPELCRMQRAI